MVRDEDVGLAVAGDVLLALRDEGGAEAKRGEGRRVAVGGWEGGGGASWMRRSRGAEGEGDPYRAAYSLELSPQQLESRANANLREQRRAPSRVRPRRPGEGRRTTTWTSTKGWRLMRAASSVQLQAEMSEIRVKVWAGIKGRKSAREGE